MAAPPVAFASDFAVAPPTRRVGPLGWLLGGIGALAATAAAGVVALLFAAALAVVALLALALGLLAYAAWRVRGARGASPTVISARWTGYGWDASGR